MHPITLALRLAFLLLLLASADAFADEQAIPPGVPKEGELSVDTGPNGLCDSAAGGDDTQLAAVGAGTPNLLEIACGPNLIVDSTASGDDVQLRPALSYCANASVPVIGTGL